jgi:hypothetical protein
MNMKVYWHFGFSCRRIEGEVVSLVPNSKLLSPTKVNAVVKVTSSDSNAIRIGQLVVVDVEDLAINTL